MEKGNHGHLSGNNRMPFHLISFQHEIIYFSSTNHTYEPCIRTELGFEVA